MRSGIFAILLLFFCLLSSQVLAASRTILRLGGVEHWADLSYMYTGSQSDIGDETEHRFEERYTLLGEYVVLSPRLWQGGFELNLGLEQETTKESSGEQQKKTGSEIEYQVNGILFSRRPASIGFSASSGTMRRSQLNAPDYDLQNDRYRISLSIANKRLPTRLSYQLSNSETSGLSADRSTTVKNFQIQATNSWGSSQTELNLNMMRQETNFSSELEELSSSSSNVSLDNHLALGTKLRPGNLHSHLSYDLEKVDATENKRLMWNENLEWKLGKALNSGIRYNLSRNNTHFKGENESTTQAASAFLQHRLFQSLVSRLDFSGRLQEMSDGRQDEKGIGLNFSYRKKIGDRTSMDLGVGGRYSASDRNFESGLRTATGVTFTVQEVDNFLPDTGILTDTVVVHNADRTIVYLEGDDYTLESTEQVTQIIIPFGSAITLGEALSIDYQFLIDPSVRYATRSFHSNGALNLRNGQLQFFYQFSQSRQEILEGEASSESFDGSRSLRAGMTANSGGHRFRLTYGNEKTATNPFDFFEGLWSYSGKVMGGRWGVQLVDTYTMYRGRDGGAGGSQTNSFRASTNYRRVWGTKSLSTRALYSSSKGRDSSRENLSMDLEYAIAIGKTQISLGSGVKWEWVDREKTQSEHVQVQLRRYF